MARGRDIGVPVPRGDGGAHDGWLPMLLCLVLSAGAVLTGFGMWSMAKSAIHEIAALVAFLIAAVYLVGACVTYQLGRIGSSLHTSSAGFGSSLKRGRHQRAWTVGTAQSGVAHWRVAGVERAAGR